MNQCVQKIYLDSPQLLLHRWHELRKKQPRLRIRDAAKLLKISEAVLLAAGCGPSVIRLIPEWQALLDNLESLGTVMALTRNDYAVHEQTGVYSYVEINGNKAVVLNDAINLRLNFLHWQFAFAVEEQTTAGQRLSLQFFGAAGTAIHKVYLIQTSHKASYHSLISQFRSSKQNQALDVDLPLPIEDDRDVELDTEALRECWRNLKQTHDFEKMLHQCQLTRFEAITLAGSEFVRPINPQLLCGFMEKITEIKIPIMLFVSNKGAVQIYSGVIHNLKKTGPWLNIRDDNFNLHLDETGLTHLYVVEKPITTGRLTSLELYDAQGNNIALIFGEYDPELGEDPVWRDLLVSLPEKRGAA